MGVRARRQLSTNRLAAREEATKARSSKAAALSIWRRASRVHLVRLDQLIGRLQHGRWRLDRLQQETHLEETRTKKRVGRTLQPIALASVLLPAGTAQAGDMVAGFDNVVCAGTFSYSFDSVDSACADWEIKAYQLESENFGTCHICDDDRPDDPPVGPPIGIGPVVPLCPTGQHAHGWECHSDHVCGDDEIGGGNEECEPCGEGEAPNEDETACVACDWGETTPGVCNREPCQRFDADAAANSALNGIKKEAQERGKIIYCENGRVKQGSWAFSGSNKCLVVPASPYAQSCLAGGSKRTGCNLTGIHSHPYFIYERDMNLMCNRTRISSVEVAEDLNRINLVFTNRDIATLTARQTDGHVSASNRSAILPWRFFAIFPMEASNDD